MGTSKAAATGVELIEAERNRQVKSEGWTTEHDDEHSRGEMIKAAQCYSQISLLLGIGVDLERSAEIANGSRWPWADEWWKPSPDPTRNLVKAGALLAAEIDRLQRAAPPVAERNSQ